MTRPAEVQLTDGNVDMGVVHVKSSGWVKIVADDGSTVHYPPHQVERVVGDATYQSPHGRV